MRVVASSSISHEKTQPVHGCCFQTEYFTCTLSGPSGLCGSTLKWRQSVARPRARRVRDVACPVSLMNRLNKKSSVVKMCMHYFLMITFSDYFVRKGDIHQRFEKYAGKFFPK